MSQDKKSRYFFCLGMIAIQLSLALGAHSAKAVEAAAGFASIEEGDDRHRPSAVLHVGLPEEYQARLYYYGRTYSVVTEKTFLLNAHRRFEMFATKWIYALFGASMMMENTQLHYSDGAAEDEEQTSYNLGAMAGVSFQPQLKGPVFTAINWESHVFLAGQAGILLATGRKQAIALVVGVNL